jgi:hypothetical protein
MRACSGGARLSSPRRLARPGPKLHNYLGQPPRQDKYKRQAIFGANSVTQLAAGKQFRSQPQTSPAGSFPIFHLHSANCVLARRPQTLDRRLQNFNIVFAQRAVEGLILIARVNLADKVESLRRDLFCAVECAAPRILQLAANKNERKCGEQRR